MLMFVRPTLSCLGIIGSLCLPASSIAQSRSVTLDSELVEKSSEYSAGMVEATLSDGVKRLYYARTASDGDVRASSLEATSGTLQSVSVSDITNPTYSGSWGASLTTRANVLYIAYRKRIGDPSEGAPIIIGTLPGRTSGWMVKAVPTSPPSGSCKTFDTDKNPTIAASGDTVLVMVKGANHDVCGMRMTFGSNYNDPTSTVYYQMAVPGDDSVHSEEAPSLVFFNGNWWVAYLSNDENDDDDYDVEIATSSDGLNWVGGSRMRIPGTDPASQMTPSLSVIDNTLFLVYTRSDGQVYQTSVTAAASNPASPSNTGWINDKAVLPGPITQSGIVDDGEVKTDNPPLMAAFTSYGQPVLSLNSDDDVFLYSVSIETSDAN